MPLLSQKRFTLRLLNSVVESSEQGRPDDKQLIFAIQSTLLCQWCDWLRN